MNGGRIRRNGRLLIACGLVAAVMLVGAFWLRSVTVDETARRICEKVDRVVFAVQALATVSSQTPQPGDYGYAYWAEHPEERAARGIPQELITQFVESATCDKDNIVSLDRGRGSP